MIENNNDNLHTEDNSDAEVNENEKLNEGYVNFVLIDSEAHSTEDSDREEITLEEESLKSSSEEIIVEPVSPVCDTSGAASDDTLHYSGNQADNSMNNSDNAGTTKNKNGKKSPLELTKSNFIIILVIVVAVSTILGALLGLALNSLHSSKAYSNLSYSSLSTATGSKLTIQEIAALNQDAVVEINTTVVTQNYFYGQQVSQGAGSGVIVKEDGYIATNNHVIEGASQVSVRLRNGKSYSASIVGSDPDNDVAVIKINAKGLAVATIGDSSTLMVGDLAVAIGNPLGQLGGTVSQGIISSTERRLTIDNLTLNLLQTDAAINPGNSGGGLFNGAGELIGIVVAKTEATGVEGLGFALPINNVAGIIDEIISTGKVSSKASIGLTIYNVSSEEASYNENLSEGIFIQEVTSAEAQEAGFKPGDRLVSINGHEVDSSSDFIARVKECKIGDTAKVVVEREGKKITIETKLIASTN